jgi:simple sugar transport system permease protein
MSEQGPPTGSAPTPQAPLGSDPEAYAPSVAGQLAFYQRAGGIITPLLTAVVAFLAGGIVVLATGHNPLRTYKAIFEGAGLNWFFHFGNYHIDLPFTNHHIWFWWNTDTNLTAAYNLTQTLLTTTPLILTGLAVAFAFRCGLFNIGGQGQYLVGAIVGVYVGSRFTDMAHLPHVIFGITAAALAGALWGSIAGFLKATVGAHEVITTIMLNWIAYWGGSYLFGRGGPLQNHVNKAVPISDDVAPGAKLAAIWGNPHLQALHSGIFVALGALVVFYIILNRTTLGYEVRAVGFNPEAARYGGISVARNFIIAMAISGLFAGLAGGLDILGWQFRLGVLDVQVSNIGFIGIAVALLGRNTAVGVGLAALLFGGLLTGTSTRSLDPNIFPPQLAGNLALMIQALVLLFVGADLLILYIWQARKKVRMPGLSRAADEAA